MIALALTAWAAGLVGFVAGAAWRSLYVVELELVVEHQDHDPDPPRIIVDPETPELDQ